MSLPFKKFSDLKKEAPVKRINEDAGEIGGTQDVDKVNMEEAPKANLPENIEQPQDNTQEQPNQESSSSGPAKLFSKLFESREMAHIYHLQVKGDEGSYAAHVALNAYYDNVLELIDELIETYQGQYDIVEGYDMIDTKDTNSKDKIEYFKGLVEFIKTERKTISEEDTHLHNIIDEITALAYKTLYKLRFNK